MDVFILIFNRQIVQAYLIMENQKKKILYVDDEYINLELFKLNFEDDYDVYIAESGFKGLDILKETEINVIISDLKMPEMNGIEFISEIKKNSTDNICILLTAFMESDVMLKAINEELVFRYILKPWKRSDLEEVIKVAFDKLNL